MIERSDEWHNERKRRIRASTGLIVDDASYQLICRHEAEIEEDRNRRQSEIKELRSILESNDAEKMRQVVANKLGQLELEAWCRD